MPGSPASDCHTEYFGYYHNEADPLDPRNDAQVWSADARSADENDLTYRTTKEIDATGRVTKVTYPKPAGQSVNPTEEFTYTAGGGPAPAGLPLTTKSRNGAITTYTHNGDGDLVSTLSPTGLLTAHTHDNIGRVIETTESSTVGQGTTYGTYTSTYNGLSQITSVHAPAVLNTVSGVTHQAVTTTTYDLAGRRISETVSDAVGGDAPRTTTWTYDAVGRQLSVTLADGRITTQEWNTSGDMVRTTKPGGLVLEYTYDLAHRLRVTTAKGTGVDPTNPAATTLTMETRVYDPAGRLASTTDASGRVTRNTYYGDNLVKATSMDRPEPAKRLLVQTFTYDAAGQATLVATAGGGMTASTYDPAGNVVVQTADPSGLNRTVTKSFNPDGSTDHQTLSTPAQTPGNLALLRPATSSAECNQWEYAAKALDGSWTGGDGDKWCSTAASKWLQVDLGAAASITGFTLRHAGAGGEPDSFNTKAYTIQVSDDGTSWTTPVTVTGNTADVTTHNNLAVSGRFVKLTVTVPAQDSDPTARIYDFEVTGTIGMPASPGRVERTDFEYYADGSPKKTTISNTEGTPTTLVTTYERDARGLLTREIDPAGVETEYAYDILGLPLSRTGAARTVWVGGSSTDDVRPVAKMGRNTFGELTHQTDANGNITVSTMDAAGRALTTTLPPYTPPGGSQITATSTTLYDDQGLPETVTDALGNVTSMTYDKYGRLLTRTDPDPDDDGPKKSPKWVYEYAKSGELLKTIDPVGGYTSATFDALGRQATSTISDRLGDTQVAYTTNMGYDDAGNLTTVTSPQGHVTTMTYDRLGQTTRTTDPTGRFVHQGFDLAGRVVSSVQGQNSTFAPPLSTTTYDLAGRPTVASQCTVTAAGTCATTLRTAATTFDAAGRVTQTTSAELRPVVFDYDDAGQLVTITQWADKAVETSAVTVELGYDPAGNKTRMVDGNGNATTYTYTSWSMPESTIEPATAAHPAADDRTWTTIYNAAGQPVEDRLPGGVIRSRTFDNLGRLTAETGTGGGTTTTARGVDYDLLGRITSATSPAGNLTFTWSERGQLLTASGHGGTATYDYDEEGKLTDRTDAAGTVTFGYDDAGRITSMTDPLTGNSTTRSYDEAGRLATVSQGSGKPSRALIYDDLGRVVTDTHTRPNATESTKTSFLYDKDNLLRQKTTTGYTGAGAHVYGHDDLGRITSWLNVSGETTTYGYDGASNRTTVTTTAGTRTSIYDARNRITATTGAGQSADSFAWSERGTLDSATRNGQTATYTFDAFERLTAVQKIGGYSVAFSYDSLDRAAQRNGLNFGYADLSNNAIISPAAVAETKLLRDPSGKAMSGKTGNAAAVLLLSDEVHADVNGNVDPTTGDLAASVSFDPWGVVLGSSGAAGPIGYQGGWTDADTGLVNAHARWYDATLGVFTSRDTWTLSPLPVAQANRYVYANASPLTRLDPTGHKSVLDEDSSGSANSSKTTTKTEYKPCGPGVPVCVQTPIYNPPMYPTPVPKKLSPPKPPPQAGATPCGPNVPVCTQTPPYLAPLAPTPTVTRWDPTGLQDTDPLYELHFNCNFANAYARDYCMSDAGQLVNLPTAGFGEQLMPPFKPGDGIADQKDWVEAFYGRPLSEISARNAEFALGAWFCYYNKAVCDANRDAKWEALWKGVTGLSDLEECVGAVKGEDGGSWWGCAWTVVNVAGVIMPVFKLGAAARGLKAGDAAADAANAGRTGSHANDGSHLDDVTECAVGAARSFAATTLVLLADGSTKAISAVVPGDSVWATDPETGQAGPRTVTGVWVHDDTLLDLGLNRGAIRVTEDHPIWNATTHTWQRADALLPGHRLLTADGSTTGVSTSISWSTAAVERAVNLTVADIHTYYVLAGNLPVLVHNAGPECGPRFVADANGEVTDLRPPSRGSTGRTTPGGANEQQAMDLVQQNAQYGNRLPVTMNDPRWHADDGWVKMEQTVNGVEIHYVYNTRTGIGDDFKFKDWN